MNYRTFLSTAGTEMVLPYARGRKVTDDRRTWKLRKELAPGWYRFAEEGRFLRDLEVAEPDWERWNRPTIQGYFSCGRIITMDFMGKLFGLPADEEGDRFAPLIVRSWFDQSLWFDSFDFEGEAEEQVREAFEEETQISRIKGVSPPLAQAYLLENTQRTMAREAEERRLAEEDARRKVAELLRRQNSVEGRLAVALAHSGAELIDWRRNGGNRAIVKYRLGGQRYECVVDTESLRILDAGICLEGTDRALNLSSLPSAVREAIDTGQLYVMRP